MAPREIRSTQLTNHNYDELFNGTNESIEIIPIHHCCLTWRHATLKQILSGASVRHIKTVCVLNKMRFILGTVLLYLKHVFKPLTLVCISKLSTNISLQFLLEPFFFICSFGISIFCIKTISVLVRTLLLCYTLLSILSNILLFLYELQFLILSSIKQILSWKFFQN